MQERSSPREPNLSLHVHFERILVGAQAGGEWAWRELYRSVAPLLGGYLRARGIPDVDDVVGETFVRVVRGIDRFAGDEGAFRAWVFTIGRNLAVDEARRRFRRPADTVPDEQLVAMAPNGDVEAEAMQLIAQDRVRAVLERLSPDQRDVLLLRILGGLTIAEISQVLHKREGAVKMLQARGLAAIRRTISEQAVTL